MRDKWYGDNRDLVKWGLLITLADRYKAKHILQVLYYRPTEWPGIELDGHDVPLPKEVIQHFRNSTSASEIQTTATIEVFADPFTDRASYQKAIIGRIRKRPVAPGIVFLDPDTGLEPRSPSFDHVLDREVAELWKELGPRDFLVFYQHQTNRNGMQWIDPKKEQFERAIGLKIGSAMLARSEQIAKDVVFFYAQKAS